MKGSFENLGRAARGEIAEMVEGSDLALRLEARVLAVAPRRPQFSWRLVPVFTLAAAAMLLFVVLNRSTPAISFTIAGEGTGNLRSPIVTREAPRLIAFSEGTTLDVAAQSEVRVLRTDARSAEVALIGGVLTARVKHVDADAHWIFRAGPYTVTVTGTAFALSWDATVSRLNIQMLEGRVLVVGGSLSSPREVRAGENLQLGEAATVAADVTDSVSPPTESPPVEGVEKPTSAAVDANTAGKLFARADAMALRGNKREAVHLFEMVSRKYPHGSLAGLASFAAGRLLLLQLHEPAKALAELERALRMGLPDPLGEECHARIVEALTILKRREDCVNEKARYLGKYRQGAHVAMVADACD